MTIIAMNLGPACSPASAAGLSQRGKVQIRGDASIAPAPRRFWLRHQACVPVQLQSTVTGEDTHCPRSGGRSVDFFDNPTVARNAVSGIRLYTSPNAKIGVQGLQEGGNGVDFFDISTVKTIPGRACFFPKWLFKKNKKMHPFFGVKIACHVRKASAVPRKQP